MTHSHYILTLLTTVQATLLTTELLLPCFCKLCEITKHCLLDSIQVLLHIGLVCGVTSKYLIGCVNHKRRKNMKLNQGNCLSILHKCLICICLLIQVCWVCESNNPGGRLMYAY